MKAKKIIIPAMALGILSLVGVTSVNSVKADDYSGHSMVQRLSERFGLNEDEVDQFMVESRETRRQETQVRHEEHLGDLVSEGAITQEQADVIVARREEMQANRGEYSGLSFEERQKMREAHRAEIDAWAVENGIDLGQLHMGDGPRGGMGKGFGRGR